MFNDVSAQFPIETKHLLIYFHRSLDLTLAVAATQFFDPLDIILIYYCDRFAHIPAMKNENNIVMPPSMASGLPGNLVEAYLAGIIPIKVNSLSIAIFHLLMLF